MMKLKAIYRNNCLIEINVFANVLQAFVIQKPCFRDCPRWLVAQYMHFWVERYCFKLSVIFRCQHYWWPKQYICQRQVSPVQIGHKTLQKKFEWIAPLSLLNVVCSRKPIKFDHHWTGTGAEYFLELRPRLYFHSPRVVEQSDQCASGHGLAHVRNWWRI